LFGSWYHFIGIGGAGMSGLARILLDLGIRVSGSDLRTSSYLNNLEEKGAIVTIGHAVENLQPGVDQVVVSSAIPSSNVELQEALRLGLSVITRGDLLAELMGHHQGIAVVGAHGKTTTSSMVGLALDDNGLDPTIIIGGEVHDIGGNAKLGQGGLLVAEADESDGSFLKLEPFAAVITNIDNDHLDYYKSTENIIQAFQIFLNRVRPDGFAVLCTDNAKVRGLDVSRVKVITYGLEGHPLYKAEGVIQNGFTTEADVLFDGDPLGHLTLHVPGRHNVQNALAAIAVGRQLGISFSDLARALATFCGVQRRFQLIASNDRMSIIDDYAHHPTEIQTMLKAAGGLGARRMVAVFQPHRYSRTKLLQAEFGRSFKGVDLVVVTDIYPAAEKPLNGVSSQLIVRALQDNGQQVKYVGDLDAVVDYLVAECRSGDLILTIGAGNVNTVGLKLAARLEMQIAKNNKNPQGVS
jgi:UDP-N-acetylmuramate--alanine ligase